MKVLTFLVIVGTVFGKVGVPQVCCAAIFYDKQIVSFNL